MKPIVQTHHISYAPPVTVCIWKGEHWILTQLDRRKRVSVGFVTALEIWLGEHKKKAVKL